MINYQHVLEILLLNTPAYICGALALWRKRRDENYYGAFVLAFLLAILLVDAVCTSQVTYVETASPLMIMMEAVVSVLIVPLLYMFHAPEGGQQVLNRTTVFLFLATLILTLPAISWDIIPAYTIIRYEEPRQILGISLYYKGHFFYHLSWVAIVLTIQSYIALSQLKKLYKMVQAHGAKYTLKSRVTYYWDFSCGYFLSLSFLLPLQVFQQPLGRWIYYIISATFISVGCFLIFRGFDLNPVVYHHQNGSSLSDFLLENGEMVNRMKEMLEEEKMYLEPGIQSDTMAQRLDTSHAYFLRMMKATYDCSFPEWVHQKRIEYSKQLLAEQKSFDQVAELCGYRNTFAFLRMFMRICDGMTASDYCRSLGNVAPIYRPKQSYDEDD